jgi:hypothetical protein
MGWHNPFITRPTNSYLLGNCRTFNSKAFSNKVDRCHTKCCYSFDPPVISAAHCNQQLHNVSSSSCTSCHNPIAILHQLCRMMMSPPVILSMMMSHPHVILSMNRASVPEQPPSSPRCIRHQYSTTTAACSQADTCLPHLPARDGDATGTPV